MRDSIVFPACFSPDGDDPAAMTRAGQSVYMSLYRTKIAGKCRLITITWCKNLSLHALSVSVEGTDGDNHYHCKVEFKPGYFWRKQGLKQFEVDGKLVAVAWDLKNAKFNGGTEPRSDYYVAIVCDDEVVLLVGDLKKNAYQKTRCRPSLIDPILVLKKEHVFGKRKFSTVVKFDEKDCFHEISIECINGVVDPQMEVRIDGHLVILVKHLQWKFRGNECITVDKTRVEVFWDVHDWLFGSGPRNGLFIFKPTSSSSSSLVSMNQTSTLGSILMSTKAENSESGPDDDCIASRPSRFCLFLYAWKVE